MIVTNPLDEARDRVLRKIGQNLVNLQKMEWMLKLLLSANVASIPVSRCEEIAKQHVNSVSKLTLGQLVQKAAPVLHGLTDSNQGRLDVLTEPEFSFSVRFDGDEKDAQAWKGEMELIVRERNALVHEMLKPFDPDSIKSCVALAASLDEQRTRYLHHYRALAGLIIMLRDGSKEIADSLAGGMIDLVEDAKPTSP